ncbi:hypothetical protein [Pseudomonas carnis]|uniref:hypothetical protein n=1 Tax=Pseudomonas carnis TaxID=2487355 RepID=UPI001DFFF2BE|nr:hypothetical protein [Pseudomonas carnis]CAH0274235.1 hypothetical protein SRABI111_03767 [Pseudomonas carnis]CAH0323316.1 hypothetical protein SRABI08_05635 [Pseudomonas carnis]CAH0324663.1 hypothetical protein SRABI110_06001 [Pseudomonas carnis]CAH0325766.1 hypothetical protein SRABI64_06025 [Pseudomonas carnis]
MLQPDHPDNIAREQAWAQLCTELGAEAWTISERAQAMAFFYYGWDAKGRRVSAEHNDRVRARHRLRAEALQAEIDQGEG